MPTVESKAEIHAVFLGNAKALAESSAKLGESVEPEKSRVWQRPPEGSTWTGRHSDIAGIADAFNRDELNDNYKRVIAGVGGSTGTRGDLIGLGLQIAWVGALERAYRARHASAPRRLALAAGRRRGHGSAAGVFTGETTALVQDVIAAGKSSKS